MADIKTRDYEGTYRYHLVATWCEYCRPPCLEKTLLRPKSAILSWPLVLKGCVEIKLWIKLVEMFCCGKDLLKRIIRSKHNNI